MCFKDKPILLILVSLYTILGANLLLVMYNMIMAMWYYFQYIFVSKASMKSFMGDTALLIIILLVIICAAIYFVTTVFVYFLFKKNNFTSTVIFSSIAIIMFGEIGLSVIYNEFYSHDLNDKTLSEMLKNMNELTDGWDNFQIGMQCCGVYDPDNYNTLQLNYTIPLSCCGRSKHSYIKECSITDSYQVGCYSKLIGNFQEHNQLIIWTSILYDMFTMFALYLMRHTRMFVLVKSKPNVAVSVVEAINVD